ncbi:peptide-methionine (S)-S-oxide reductase MsrA [uncultured Sneathiella sp.]|uniref:peptide-methionine (S)-S-oxide reductase MsrA n=1 Tax=uncultured Sneathiella sp. TaxID=879315 RepID=UPI0030D8E9F9
MTILGFGLLGYSSRAVAAEETAILAGGCFWCVESDYDHVPGVISTTSGYIGGETPNPTYKAVSAGGTGNIEAVKIVFDPDKTSYSNILDVFWRSVDPTDDGGQFCDRGESYKTAIFATTDAQKETAQSSKAALNESGVLKKPIVTEIRDASKFYPAEEYHQDYYNKNPIRYKFYRFSCGRDAKIVELWGDQAHQGILDH